MVVVELWLLMSSGRKRPARLVIVFVDLIAIFSPRRKRERGADILDSCET